MFTYCIKDELLSIQQKEILQKAKKNYSKEKAAEYYLLNKEEIKKGIKIWQTKKTSKKKNTKKTVTRT